MKILLLYEYPLTESSNSIQGSLLHRGLLELGIECKAAHYEERDTERKLLLKTYRPDIVLGIGWWANTPEIIIDPKEHGLLPVPWLLSDGWVANYQDIIGSLPLVFTTSRWVTQTYARDGVDTKHFEVLHVGFDPKLFRPLPKIDEGVRETRRMFGVRDDEKMILTVGGDATSKGAQEVIRALGILDNEFSRWKYVCKVYRNKCSTDHHKEELRLIAETGINPEKFIYCEDDFMHETMPFLLNACDLYVAPSRVEGFGLIQLEAMACGIPVVSIDAMGPKDTIVHGETGFLAKVASTIDLESELVSSDMGLTEERIYFDKPKTFAYRADVDDLAKFTFTLLTDDKLRKKMGENAATHARAHFQYQDLAGKCVEILKKKFAT